MASPDAAERRPGRAALRTDDTIEDSVPEVTVDLAQLDARDALEHREAIGRYVNAISNFLDGWAAAAHLDRDPNRDEVLAALSDFDRDRFLRIEATTTWPKHKNVSKLAGVGIDVDAWLAMQGDREGSA